MLIHIDPREATTIILAIMDQIPNIWIVLAIIIIVLAYFTGHSSYFSYFYTNTFATAKNFEYNLYMCCYITPKKIILNIVEIQNTKGYLPCLI